MAFQTPTHPPDGRTAAGTRPGKRQGSPAHPGYRRLQPAPVHSVYTECYNAPVATWRPKLTSHVLILHTIADNGFRSLHRQRWNHLVFFIATAICYASSKHKYLIANIIRQSAALTLRPQHAPPVLHLQVICTKMLQISVLVICRNSSTVIGYYVESCWFIHVTISCGLSVKYYDATWT